MWNIFERQEFDTWSCDDFGVMSLRPQEGLFLYAFLRLYGVKNVIEIGTYHGFSSTCIAKAIVYNGGKLLTIDCDQSVQEIAKRNFNKYQCNNIRLIHGISDNVPSDFIADACLIDSNHEYEWVIRDFKNLYPLVTRFFFFHDYRCYPGVQIGIGKILANYPVHLLLRPDEHYTTNNGFCVLSKCY